MGTAQSELVETETEEIVVLGSSDVVAIASVVVGRVILMDVEGTTTTEDRDVDTTATIFARTAEDELELEVVEAMVLDDLLVVVVVDAAAEEVVLVLAELEVLVLAEVVVLEEDEVVAAIVLDDLLVVVVARIKVLETDKEEETAPTAFRRYPDELE